MEQKGPPDFELIASFWIQVFFGVRCASFWVWMIPKSQIPRVESDNRRKKAKFYLGYYTWGRWENIDSWLWNKKNNILFCIKCQWNDNVAVFHKLSNALWIITVTKEGPSNRDWALSIDLAHGNLVYPLYFLPAKCSQQNCGFKKRMHIRFSFILPVGSSAVTRYGPEAMPEWRGNMSPI